MNISKIFLASFLSFSFIISGCKKKEEDVIIFGVSADYPPFEFYKDNHITGFDIELAKLIAKELKKKVVFEDMQFGSILASVQNATIDAGISTITATDERKKNFDFSDGYYEESLSILYLKTLPINKKEDLQNKKIACQLGTTMDIWLKENTQNNTEIVRMNNNNQAVEALKAGHVQGVLIDGSQAISFTRENPELSYSSIGKSSHGYAVVFKKGCTLREAINKIIKKLRDNGDIDKLKQKWLERI